MASNKRKLSDTDNGPKSSKVPPFSTLTIGENVVQNASIQKLVKLAKTSKFFKSILKNRTSQTIVITPPESVDRDCLHRVLQGVLVHWPEMRVDKSDIKQVLRVAQFLDLRRPIDWVTSTLKETLSRENAYELWNAVADSGAQYHEDLVVNKLRSNFGYFAASVEFQQCSVKELACIIAGGSLEIESELQLLKTILSWCKANRNTRWTKDALSCLLQEIHWELIPVDFVEAVLAVAEEPLPHVVTQLLEECLPPSMNCNAPSPPRHFQEVVIFLNEMGFQCYRSQNRSIISHRARLSELIQNEGYPEHWMISLNEKVWMPVGEGEMVVLEPSNWEQKEMTKSISCTSEVSPLVCCGLVYVLDTLSFEVYEPDFNVRSELPLPSEARMVTGWDAWGTDVYLCGEVRAECAEAHGDQDNAVSTDQKARVFVESDRSPNATDREAIEINRMCRFSTVTKKWTDCAPMKMARRELSITSYNGSIYAIGGKRGMDVYTTTSTCERYDIASSAWHPMANLTIARRRHCSFVLNNRLHVAGGLSEFDTPVTLMEVYDEEKDQWEIVVLDAKHAQPVCPLACVVVRTSGFS